jgi:lipopolysaccharide transport system permease protein
MTCSLLSDSLSALRIWRVWLFLGLQDIKGRFRRSIIGPLWLLINLALFVVGAGVVYGLLFRQPMAEFLPFLTAGFVIWGFIVSTLTEGGHAFVNAEGYIKQFPYPKQIYILRALVGFAIIFFIGLMALAGSMLAFGNFTPLGWLFSIPGILVLFLSGLAHVTISAYWTTRFRDIPHALGGLFQVLFFVTPIMFPVSVLRERGLDFVYQFNPLHYLIDMVRHPLLKGEFAEPESYAFGLLYLLLVWVLAYFSARMLDSRVVFLL